MYGVTQLDVSENIALISLHKIPLDPAVISDIFGQFSQAKINIDMVSQTAPLGDQVTISFTCPDSEMVKVLEISRVLSGRHPQVRPMVSSGNCKLRLYGEEMRTSHGVFAKALSALLPTRAELQQVSTSEVDISFLISAAQLAEAVAALSKTFEL